MNRSAQTATALVSALAGHRVTDVVLCPGSRSAPLAYALAAADRAAVLRLHVRHDERSAGFTALGMGLAGGHPAAVVTTSGTAVANLHPAVLEAHEGGVPLLVVTADRPHRLRGTWANQTTSLQAGMFGAATRLAVDLAAESGADAVRGAVADAVLAAVGRGVTSRAGPAHLDVALDDPLVPGDPPPPPPRMPRRHSAPAGAPGRAAVAELGGDSRTVVVAGSGAGGAARRLAESAAWPLLAEPSSGACGSPNAVRAYRLLLDETGLGGRIQRVVALGRPTLSRPVTRLLARRDVHVVHVVRTVDEPGPAGPVQRVVGEVEATGEPDRAWLADWLTAGAVAGAAVDAVLDAGPLTGPLVAREVAAVTRPDEVLVAAASNAIRDLDLAADSGAASGRVLANRGVSGIDGTVSTAAGAALVTGATTRALVGDLAFLHDLNGLLLGPQEPMPTVQVVVLNDDGGGIFALLEHGEPQHAEVFERVFGTPHGADLAALCAGLHVRHAAVHDVAGLRQALRNPAPGRSVLEVRVPRDGLRDLHARIRSTVAVAVRAMLT